MKKMFVCGDSFMTPAWEAPDLHFSEILSKKINYDLKTYARGGMSNGGICIQIESAIKKQADLIILNTTMADRLEIPIIPGEGIPDTAINIDHILYNHPQSLSSYDPELNQNPKYHLNLKSK